ncbi:3'-5' exonuclease [Alkalibacillus silvisoli]|uniref:Nuclease-related domain-containing DEAD/DEAH box helicase n=1 Tax=Alkalibacillus silvisoli TaxID=392823 RepID=A0ABP3JX54_9BACI
MALTVPETIRRTATSGERTLFNTLKEYLPEDYIVYFEPEIHGRRPDFVIIGPDLGVIVIEVKDWTLNTIVKANKDEWLIFGRNQQQAMEKNPYKKAEEFTFHLMNHLKKDSHLIQSEGKNKHNLKFPCGYGAVFSRLNTSQLSREQLYSVIDPQFCLGRDEIDPDHENFSEEVLIEKLMNMFKINFRLREPLSKADIDAIRHKLFPEVRISGEFKQPAPHQDQILLSMHNLKTMDIHQENYAKNLGDKNRLIRGVAGSGKTLILATRAALLARENPDWNILILCYNISLANYLKQLIDIKVTELESEGDQGSLFDHDQSEVESFGNIEVYNFHSFLYNHFKIKDEQIPSLINSLKDNNQLMKKYDAILIDEGQDFEQEWLNLVSHLLNPTTQSLLLVEDRAQNIYKRKRSYVEDTGLSFQGRSKILSINYRNTQQIVRFAWDFYRHNSSLSNKVAEQEFEGEIIAPKTTPRKGPEPYIHKANRFTDEMDQVSRVIDKLNKEHNIPFSEMVILYRVKWTSDQNYIGAIKHKLQSHDIPHYWISENAKAKRNYAKDDNKVKISTIESSKGLDFQAVFIVSIDQMPFHLVEDENREAALLYIAMTRAHKYLCLSYSGESVFTQYLDGVKEEQQNSKDQQSG